MFLSIHICLYVILHITYVDSVYNICCIMLCYVIINERYTTYNTYVFQLSNILTYFYSISS